MEQYSLERLRTDAKEALEETYLTDALTCIKGILHTTNDIQLNNEWDSIQKDYEMMLAFMQQGGTDPQRASIFRKLVTRSYALLDMGMRNCRLQNKKDPYAAFCLHILEKEISFSQLADKARILQEKITEDSNRPPFKDKEAVIAKERREFYEVCDCIFKLFWTAPILNTDEAKEWQAFIEEMNTDTQAMLVSAVMLACQEYFDPQKYRILLYFCRSTQPKVRARALTAAVWIYMFNKNRFEHHADLRQGLSLLASEPTLYRELVLLQKQFVLSIDTTKADTKINTDILPGILQKRLQKYNNLNPSEMNDELYQAIRKDLAEELEKQLYGDQSLANNMEKIMKMGQEGIDINFGTFSTLKRFPFFNEISHWFVSFDENRPEIKDVVAAEENGSLRTLINRGNFCDSDKYSLCMMFTQISPEQKEMIINQVGQGAEEQEEPRQNKLQGNVEIKYIYRNYLQDLYRFFRLNHGQSMKDPFEENLYYSHYDVLSSMMNSPEYIKEIIDFMLHREHYNEAIYLLDDILKEQTATAEILQKMGLCYQQTESPEKAVYYYQQAELLCPNNEWLLTQMAKCYSATGKHKEELPCLQKLLELNPNDNKLIAATGKCLIQLRRYEEAVQRFYELEYKGARPLLSWRAIAWCNFKINKLEQADKYYRKLLNCENATWEDYLNAGHTAWCMNKFQEAVGHYRTFIKMYRTDSSQKKQTPLWQFDKDKFELISHGIPQYEISMMRDIITAEQK